MTNLAKKKQNKNLQIYNLKKKSPATAVLLSLVFTGAGHLYLGKVGAAIIYLVIQILLWFVLMGWIMWIITPIAAYYDAKKHNELLALELDIEVD